MELKTADRLRDQLIQPGKYDLEEIHLRKNKVKCFRKKDNLMEQ